MSLADGFSAASRLREKLTLLSESDSEVGAVEVGEVWLAETLRREEDS